MVDSKPQSVKSAAVGLRHREGAEQAASATTTGRHGLKKLIENWWKTIAAVVIMLVSLTAIILILAIHQNKPLPDWPFSITLNALISIMVVILKSSMLAIIAAGRWIQLAVRQAGGLLTHMFHYERSWPNQVALV